MSCFIHDFIRYSGKNKTEPSLVMGWKCAVPKKLIILLPPLHHAESLEINIKWGGNRDAQEARPKLKSRACLKSLNDNIQPNCSWVKRLYSH